jgi:hypothetical protein
MKSIFLFICGFLYFSSLTFSQHWESLGSGLEYPNSVRAMYSDTFDNYLYVSGEIGFIDGKKIKGIARWDGLSWDSLQAGIDGLDTLNNYPNGPTLAITRFNNELYVGGPFNSVGNIRASKIAKWNGNNWDSLSIRPFPYGSNKHISAFEVINNELYVGGYFDTIANIPCDNIAKWNGTYWECIDLPNSLSIHGASINTICEYNGEIYVGGNFATGTPNDSLRDIIRYDGVNWKSVGGGIKGSNSDVNDMLVYNGFLYVAGYFSQSDGNTGDNIQIWDGTSWSDIGGVSSTFYSQIFDLQIFHNDLYVVGEFNNAGQISAQNIAVWKGNQWCSLNGRF